LPDLGQFAIVLGALLFSLTIHEMAHAVTALWYGDSTAQRLGRISLNPLVHLDPVGSLLLPVMGFFFTGFIFGWAKPVPVNPANLKNHRQDFLVIAAAGPASNILLAALGTLLLGIVDPDPTSGSQVGAVIDFFIRINILLAVFNMLPIPPLDGGNVLAGLLPERLAAAFDRTIRPIGFLIVLGLLLTGTLSALIGGPITFIRGLLNGWLLP